MVTMVILIVGLLAVASATTSTSLLRKRGIQEDAVFNAMLGQMNWVRGELYSDSDFHAATMDGLATGAEYSQSFLLDADGDGQQDMSATAGDNQTPILQVTVSAADGVDDSSVAVQVDVNASWYGVSGVRTRTLGALIANRRGYDD